MGEHLSDEGVLHSYGHAFVASLQADASVTDIASYLAQFPSSRETSRKTKFVKLTRVALVAGTLLLMLASAACMGGGGSSYGSSTASTPAATKASAASSGSPASSGTQKQLTITAKDFSFSADAVNVAKGDTIAITFKNSGSATHTLTFYSDAAYNNAIAGGDTGSVSGGATKALTVTADVGLFYRCNIHPTQMQGKIDFK